MASQLRRLLLLLTLPASAFAHCCSSPSDCEETPGYNLLTAWVSGLIGMLAALLTQTLTGNGSAATAQAGPPLLPGIPVSPPVQGHPMYLPPEQPGGPSSSVPVSPLTEDIEISADEAAALVGALYSAIALALAIAAAAPALSATLTSWAEGAQATLSAYWAARQSGALESPTVQTLLQDIGARLNGLQKLMAIKEAGISGLPGTMAELRAVLSASWNQLAGADRVAALSKLAGRFPSHLLDEAMELARQEKPLNEIMKVLGIAP